ICASGRIFAAWSDEPWVVDGAAVRVSIVCFDRSNTSGRLLNGERVAVINPDLTGKSVDLSGRKALRENRGVCFVGVILNGEFEVPGSIAREWLRLPRNVNDRPNSDVLRPTLNGDDFNGSRPDKWVIDFGTDITERDAALYERPFEH